jgi:hypothetical protein
MPRRVDVSVPIGTQPAGVTARLWASDQQGVLEESGPYVEAVLAGSREDPRYGEGLYGCGPYGLRQEHAAFGESPYGWQDYGRELALIELPGPEYEEGLLPFGVSVRDRFGAESSTPPTTGSIYVNDSPARLRSAEVAVADDVVTMTVASEAL